MRLKMKENNTKQIEGEKIKSEVSKFKIKFFKKAISCIYILNDYILYLNATNNALR